MSICNFGCFPIFVSRLRDCGSDCTTSWPLLTICFSATEELASGLDFLTQKLDYLDSEKLLNITKTSLCNKLQFFTTVKMIIFS